MLQPIEARGIICHDGRFIGLIQVGDGVFIGLNDGTVASPNFLNRVIASKYTPPGAKPLQALACNISNEGRIISMYECPQAREFAIYVGLLRQTLHAVGPQGQLSISLLAVDASSGMPQCWRIMGVSRKSPAKRAASVICAANTWSSKLQPCSCIRAKLFRHVDWFIKSGAGWKQ